MNILIYLMLSLMYSDNLTVTSPAFKVNGIIPEKFTCQGKDINPEINIDNIPVAAKSLTIIMTDPDAPGGNFDHWVVYDIKPMKTIAENATLGTAGKNGTGKNGYKGPCPPTGIHRYIFKVYALDAMLKLKEGADKKTIETALKSHILASGELLGKYQKSK